MSKKYYSITTEQFNLVQGMKMPLQQKQILRAMSMMDRPSVGTAIVAYAIEHCNLQTKQSHDVLYAWYARSNERFGAKMTMDDPNVVRKPEALIESSVTSAPSIEGLND